MWKAVYILLVACRFFWATLPQLGYIHPDEFFQGPERIAGDVLGYHIDKIWEFDPSFPVRSPILWYLICGYPYILLKLVKATRVVEVIHSGYLIVLPRLLMTFLSLLTDAAAIRLSAVLHCDPYFAGCLCASSFVTLVFYTRTFSNSIEALIFGCLLMTVVESTRNLAKPNHTERQISTLASGKENSLVGEDEQSRSLVKTTDDSSTNNSKEKVSSLNPEDKNDEMEHDKDDLKSCKSHAQTEKLNTSDSGNISTEKTTTMGEKSQMGKLMEGAEKQNRRSEQEQGELALKQRAIYHRYALKIALIVVIGVWNRPTFLAFAIVPTSYWLVQGNFPKTFHQVISSGVRGLATIPYLLNACMLLIMCDTMYYHAVNRSNHMSLLDSFVITPLNFILYNKQSDNLEKHGLHPRFLHFAVNMPLLFGPLAAFVIITLYIKQFLNNEAHRKILSLMFFSTAVPLALLSIFPHQEARFLIPLLGPCVVITTYSLQYLDSRFLYLLFFFFWVCHNLFLASLFAVTHQAGVIPSLIHFHEMKMSGAFHGGVNLVYHRTYMPPKSLLQITQAESKFIHLIDLQGRVKDENLLSELSQLDSLYLVTPYSLVQVESLLADGFNVEEHAYFYPHLTLEDFPAVDSLFPTDSHGYLIWDEMVKAVERNLRLYCYHLMNKSAILRSHNQVRDVDTSQSYKLMYVTLPKHKSIQE